MEDLFSAEEGLLSDETDSDAETDTSSFPALSRTSSRSSVSMAQPGGAQSIHALSTAAAEHEFQAEVTQSLDRAFAEGHSVDNAAVELKTLRMASNVDLRRVREAVVAAIVERIPVTTSDAAAQRKEITDMISRWGPLIDRIGGIDAVETIEVLQVRSLSFNNSPETKKADLITDVVSLCAVNTAPSVRPDPGGVLPGRHCRRRRHPRLARESCRARRGRQARLAVGRNQTLLGCRQEDDRTV